MHKRGKCVGAESEIYLLVQVTRREWWLTIHLVNAKRRRKALRGQVEYLSRERNVAIKVQAVRDWEEGGSEIQMALDFFAGCLGGMLIR